MKAARIHNFGGPLFSRGTQLSLWNLSHHSTGFSGLQKTVVCAIRAVHVSQAFTLKN